MFRFELLVTPKKGARDPQAEAVSTALKHSDFPHVAAEVVGRYLRFVVEESDADRALALAHRVCQEFLVNPNLETYTLRSLSPEDHSEATQ